MGKRKEIKFVCKGGQTLEGRQDGVRFWIRKKPGGRPSRPVFSVAANDTKGKGRTIFTDGYEYFTLNSVYTSLSQNSTPNSNATNMHCCQK